MLQHRVAKRSSAVYSAKSNKRLRIACAGFSLVAVLLANSCLSNRRVETYYGVAAVPPTEELRWSDGGLPKSFDPARAAAAPETDVVRALFEGLTEYDAQTLTIRPAAASGWESSPDRREWTFTLRRDARWSNGDPVTAEDFARSWRRVLELTGQTPHADLLRDIEGADQFSGSSEPSIDSFGAQAVNDFTLRVRLVRPNANFPDLVAHTVFRPVHRAEGDLTVSPSARIVTNGAFVFHEATPDAVTLERALSYWDAGRVQLNRVRFLNARGTEEALALYRAGELDAVTNANLEPLAVKLLSPYRDFRRSTFGALVYYEFNLRHQVFADRRVREALAISVNRARLCADIMDGATEPAEKFLPRWGNESESHANAPVLRYDAQRARQLLSDAGYPGGKNFPRLRLLVNRNDQQRAVALAVAEMWRSTLGIETELDVRPWGEYVAAIKSGDFDVARRRLVLQTTEEMTNLLKMFEPSVTQDSAEDSSAEQTENLSADAGSPDADAAPPAEGASMPGVSPESLLSEEQALAILPAVPIYFSSSFSLVKPYVQEFHHNLLDARSLKDVRLDRARSIEPTPRAAIWDVGD